MGHLLGAPPPGAGAAASDGLSVLAASERRVVAVRSVRVNPVADGIAAFAIDTPRQGDELPGLGVEINGWVIGRYAPIAAVRAVCDERAGPPAPLDVHRPDVAADYPGIPHAAASGFSFWAPLDPDLDDWQITIQAQFADSRAVALAEIQTHLDLTHRHPPPGHRLVAAPDFVIIGTQRGGTTSLHAYLSAHPRIVTPATKELHFLTDRHERGPDWYLGQFPSTIPLGAITGEATPYALFHPLAPQRLREIAPDAKLIVLLRNPVDRAYSHYLMERSRGDETRSFAEALAAEPALLAGEEDNLLADPGYISRAHKHASYVSRGDYAPQLERWFAHFSREQFLILRSEDLYARPGETFALATSFLGLPSAPDLPFDAHNRTAGPPLDPAIRQRLIHHFAPLNHRLAELIGWDPGWE
jgi:hypothetical protein